jgi:hypothetical protein
MKKLIVSILFLNLVVFCSSCKKDTDEYIVTGVTTINLKDSSVWVNESVVTSTGTSSDIGKLVGEISKVSDKKSFDAEAGAKIVTSDDVTVEIPANACVGKDNKPCKGKVDIEVIFLRNKGDLIANDKPTIAGGRLLISGGVAYILAKQDSNIVTIATGKTVKIRFKNSSADDDARFYEGKAEGPFKFDWKPLTGAREVSKVTVWEEKVQSVETKGYEIVTDRFGWISCAKPYDEGTLTTKFSVSLASEFTNRNTSVFLVFKDINSVVKLEGNPSTRDFTIANGHKGIPIGKKVSIVSTSKFNTYSMMAIQDATISANGVVKLTPTRMTNEEMQKKLQGL